MSPSQATAPPQSAVAAPLSGANVQPRSQLGVTPGAIPGAAAVLAAIADGALNGGRRSWWSSLRGVRFKGTMAATLPEAGAIMGLVVVLWAVIPLHLAQLRYQALTGAQLQSDNLVLAFEQNISRLISAVDDRLDQVRRAARADPARVDLQQWHLHGSLLSDITTIIGVVDLTGHMVASSAAVPSAPLDLSDRPHIRFHFANPDDVLYIGEPEFGRASRRVGLHFTRKLFDAAGNFAGVVIISIDPVLLSGFYNELRIGSGSVVLVGLDGVVRARAPGGASRIGAIEDLRLAQATDASAQGGFVATDPVSGALRVISYRRLSGYPLIAAVELSGEDVLAGYRTSRDAYLIGGAVLTLLLFGFGALLVQRKHRLLCSQRMLRVAMDNIDQGVILIDPDGRAPVISRRAAELLDLPAALLATTPSFGMLLRHHMASGEFLPPDGSADTSGLVVRDVLNPADTVHERIRPNGTVLEFRTRALPEGGVVRTLTDITDRRADEARIRFLAHHDVLTGLANRLLFTSLLEQTIAEAQAGQTVAVLFLDLDRFKHVNDAYGHHAGDHLLTLVAERLRDTVRDSDLVGRMGGDEFAVLVVTPIGRPAVARLADRLHSAVVRPYDIDGVRVSLGCSIGVAMHPADGDAAIDLLKSADLAMYRAKRGNHGGCLFFEPGMDAELRRRSAMEADLAGAIEREELRMVYQPVFDVETGIITGCEALLRWQHPDRGNVSPAEFVPVAESCGLIVKLGAWALEQACAEAMHWPSNLTLAVNLSPAQFWASDLLAQIDAITNRTGLPPSRLSLEVTEGLMIDDPSRALVMMQAIRARGIGLWLDDFGTGHASLSYLRDFPFDKIKIDRSFIAALGNDEQAVAIVQAIVSLSRALNLAVVAEGLETEQQFDVLRRLHCDQVQGFLTGRPMEVAAIRARLDQPVIPRARASSAELVAFPDRREPPSLTGTSLTIVAS
jgi:diguanylate cyclase (GGDEF)-like protein